MKKITAVKLVSLTPPELNKLTRDELAFLVRSTEVTIQRRLKTIKKAGRYSWSGENYMGSRKTSYKVKGKNRNQLLAQAFNQQSFLSDKSSTLAGIKRIEKAQDKRLFGTTSKGKAKGTLSPSERSKMWELYSEFMEDSRYAKWGAILGYNKLQQFFAEQVASREYTKENYFEAVNQTFREMYEEQKNAESFGNGKTNTGGNDY